MGLWFAIFLSSSLLSFLSFLMIGETGNAVPAKISANNQTSIVHVRVRIYTYIFPFEIFCIYLCFAAAPGNALDIEWEFKSNNNILYWRVNTTPIERLGRNMMTDRYGIIRWVTSVVVLNRTTRRTRRITRILVLVKEVLGQRDKKKEEKKRERPSEEAEAKGGLGGGTWRVGEWLVSSVHIKRGIQIGRCQIGRCNVFHTSRVQAFINKQTNRVIPARSILNGGREAEREKEREFTVWHPCNLIPSFQYNNKSALVSDVL